MKHEPVKPLTVLTDQSARVVLPSHTMCGGDRLELSETSTETCGAVCVARREQVEPDFPLVSNLTKTMWQ